MVLLTVLRKAQLRERQVRVLFLGLDNAGKSTIVSAALDRPPEEVQPTLGFKIESLALSGYTLNIWDVGGQQSLRPFWHNYFEKSDFLVWVVDSTAPHRLNVCRDELHSVLNEDRLQGAGLLVYINKMDLIPPEEREKLVKDFTDSLELESLSRHNYRVIGCSAYSKQGVNEGLDYIVSEISGRLFVLS